MNRKMKMIVGTAIILGIVSTAFLTAPIQAYINETNNGDLLQAQDRDRPRTQRRDCVSNGTCAQYQHRQRTNECAASRICNCTMNLERYRNQDRERTRNQGI
ncbi:MAG: hypothetical protein PVF15_04550 [Candidatus Bathyarchaeota archaeon]